MLAALGRPKPKKTPSWDGKTGGSGAELTEHEEEAEAAATLRALAATDAPLPKEVQVSLWRTGMT